MLISLEQQHDWVYSLRRKPVRGNNYIAETLLKLCWGRPTTTGFDGYRLTSMHSVKYDGSLLTCNSTRSAFGGCVFNHDEAIQVCIEVLLEKLSRYEYARPTEFYSRESLVGCAGAVLLSHELQYAWEIKPVSDERLWRRYVDSINRAAADAVVR